MHGKLELGQLSPPASRSKPANSLTHDTRLRRKRRQFLHYRIWLAPPHQQAGKIEHNLAIHHAITHSHVDLAGEAFELSPQPHGSRSIRIAPVDPTVAARRARNSTLICHPAIMARNVRADWMEPAAHGAGGPAPGGCQGPAGAQARSRWRPRRGASRRPGEERP